jgi:hypothetical protein
VSALEVEAKISMAVAADRAMRLAHESENRNVQINRQINRRQWVVNSSIAMASIIAGCGATLFAAHLG